MLSQNLNKQNPQHQNQYLESSSSSFPGESESNNNQRKGAEQEKDLVGEFDYISRMPHPQDATVSGVKTQHSSPPNTPDHLHQLQHLQQQQRKNSGGRNPVLENSSRVMTPSGPPLKKEKMELNERILREGRPLSYHGKFSSSSLTSLSTSPLVKKRQLMSPVHSHTTGQSNRPTGQKNEKKERNLNGSLHRRSLPPGNILPNKIQNKEKFDLSDLDTNLPRIDIEAIENHLRVAGEEEKKRRTDRDEIRRRLALESTEEMGEKTTGRKPSLHSRLQSSMNLQICFMNETASDSESPGSDTEVKATTQPGSLPHINTKTPLPGDGMSGGDEFYVRQAKLQADARQALSQAKDLARIQMSHEKERRRYSPITEMVRNSLQKVGMTLSPERRRLSRQLLTEMNVAQLQVIVNDLHSHIEHLNEKLMAMLLDRDELHMEQDSMLVDIEDLTRYLTAKENSHQSLPLMPQPKSLLGRK